MRLFDVTRRVPMSVIAPCSVALDRARQRGIDEFLWREREIVDPLRQEIQSKLSRSALDHGAGVDERAQELLRSFRRWSHGTLLSRAMVATDAAARSTAGEIMDLPWVPRWMRRLEMSTLDRVNVELGSYERWAIALDRALQTTHGAPPSTLMDLAAGSGGFFRFLARSGLARSRGWSLIATDIERTYVEQGARECAREGVSDQVRCETRSAVELESLRGTVDLFVCTQALHHMPPGLVLRVIAGAIRSAPRGIVLIDLVRGAMLSAMTGIALSAVARVPFVVWDGVQSVRRAYLPSELVLLAKLAGAGTVDARWEAPAHQIVHARQ